MSRAGCSPCSQLIPKVYGCGAAGLAQPAAERRDEKWLEKLESGQKLPRVAKGSRTKRGQTLRRSPSQKSLVFHLEMPSGLALPVLMCQVSCGSSDGDFAMHDHPQEGLCVSVKGCKSCTCIPERCRCSFPVPGAGFGGRNTSGVGLSLPDPWEVPWPHWVSNTLIPSGPLSTSLTVPAEPSASQDIGVCLEASIDPRNLVQSWREPGL